MNIQLENISYDYSIGTPFQKRALDEVSLEIRAGEVLGIIGHTGSGKSTLLKHLNGLLKPTSGRVLLDGKDIHEKGYKLRDVRFHVGLVFQYPEYQLFEETIAKDVAFGPKNMKLDEEEIDMRVRGAMRFVGLDEDMADKSPFELSGGQKRRAAIAGVIAMQPQILVLDEPTAGLDPRGRDDILTHIMGYQCETKSTVVLVSHNMDYIARLCDRVIVLNKAKVAMQGTVPEIFARADELMEMGLDVPQVTKVFLALKKRGYDVRTDLFTAEQARDEILGKINPPTPFGGTPL